MIGFSPPAPMTQQSHFSTCEIWRRRSEHCAGIRIGWKTSSIPSETACWLHRVSMDQSSRGTWTATQRTISRIKRFSTRQVRNQTFLGIFNFSHFQTGLMRCRLSPDASKLVICTTGGYLIIIHDLDLSSLARDLAGFRVRYWIKPNDYTHYHENV